MATNEELDLQEANVTSVTYNKLTDDNYNFDVTLYHDDDGEDGYADKWQVEELNGNVLGTRILTHGHGTVEFTRSATILIPDEIETVVIRGHDQIHKYGGQVLIVSLLNVSQVFINQGLDPLNFSSFEFRDYINATNESKSTPSLNFDTVSTTANDLRSSDKGSIDFNFGFILPTMLFLNLIAKYKTWTPYIINA